MGFVHSQALDNAGTGCHWRVHGVFWPVCLLCVYHFVFTSNRFFWPILRNFKVVLYVFVNVKCEEHLCFVHLTASLTMYVRKS